MYATLIRILTTWIMLVRVSTYRKGVLGVRTNNLFTSSVQSPKTDRRARKLMDLLNDIKSVAFSPGMVSVGVVRTLQVARAVNRVSFDFLKDSTKYSNKDKSISIPKSMRRLFEEFGATYIKLGQFIASSPTLFPAEYVKEFQVCLDKSPSVTYSVIREIIEEDLGRPISAVYASVDPIPIASASIAQVHRAKLLDGSDVVIKVRKPGVDSTLKADLSFLLIASKLIEFINPQLSSLSLSNIVSDIRESMMDELDFHKESANLDNFRSFLLKHNIVDAVAPKPYPAASGTRVLTMEYLRGVPLVDLEGIRKFTASPEETLISALRTWAMTVSLNDKFHADLHAGNLLVLEDGRVGFIDFGIVGKISQTFRAAVEELFMSLVQEDYQGMARALSKMGATDTNVNIDKFGADLKAVVLRINALQPEITVVTNDYGKAVEARVAVDERETTQLVLDIVAVAESNGLRLPREFGLILKQALYFDRYQKLLAPSMDPLRDSRIRDQFNSQVLSVSSVSGGSYSRTNESIVDAEFKDA